jgi:hypothetical protein
MSIYLNTITNEYPRYIGDLYLIGYEDGQTLPDGWVEVIETIAPDIQDGKINYEETPIEIDGVWTQQWATRDLTQEEIDKSNQLFPKPVVPESSEIN